MPSISSTTGRLLSSKSEALVSNDLEILALRSEVLSNSLLVAITELELLINEAVLLEELSQTTISNVLDHSWVQRSSLLLTYSLLDVASLLSLLRSQPTLLCVALDVILRVNVSWVDASLLQSSVNSLLYELFLSLGNSNLELCLLSLLRNRRLVESYRAHSSIN